MTKAGTGDILAGVLGALLARGSTILESACAASFITGSAGDIAAKEYGESLMAEDIIQKIYKVLKRKKSKLLLQGQLAEIFTTF